MYGVPGHNSRVPDIRPGESWKMLQSLDRFYDRGHGPGSSIGIVLAYVFGHGDQVRAGRSQPFNVHVGSNA